MSTIEDPELELETLAEPYRIKMIEKARLPRRAEREEILRKAFYTVVYINAADVFIDMFTDSGTGAMSDQQWAALMRGDESYIRSRSFHEFEEAVRETLGFPHVVPTHQGRAAENILMTFLIDKNIKDPIVLCNTHFDTTRAHVMHRGATPVDLVGDWLWEFKVEHPFKGNFDLARLEAALAKHHERVPFILITVLNNFACSSPVSMENIREVSRLARRWGKPVYFDACRFAENAWFIKTREAGYQDKSITAIIQEMLSYGEGCWVSAKKDAIVNIGGFIAVKDAGLARKCQELGTLLEGFPTYGGLAGRDLEAIAVGLREVVEEDYLTHRIKQVEYLARLFEQAGITVSKPSGGSGVFIDLQSLYGHLPPERFPSITLLNDTYLEGGVRTGAYPFRLHTVTPQGDLTEKHFQFARFAIPRRVYTKSHLDYVGKVMARVKEQAPKSKGFVRVDNDQGPLSHFYAKFKPAE